MKASRISSLSLFILCSVLSISLIGCGDSTSATNNNGNNNNGGGNEPAPNEVGMSSQSYSPSSIEVEVGTTVMWSNESDVVHTVTSGTDGEHDGNFDSGNISPGGQFSYTFNEVGTYPYFCVPHVSAGMTGTVTVVESY
ncbi:MAG: plastocyanin/azurin family copper-binding protein [Gracilimonas sp.]